MKTTALKAIHLCVAAGLTGASVARADEIISFTDSVLPLLQAKCISCHGSEKQEGGLRLDSAERAGAGGDRGPALVPGAPDKSLLIESITFQNPDLQMPPKQKLSAKEIETFTQWVRQGASWPKETRSVVQPESAGDAFTDPNNPIRRLFGEERLDLWSLRKPEASLRKSLISETRGDSQAMARQIDGLIRERLEKEQLIPSPEADRRTLIRRVTFDLIGLPPTPEDVDAFVADMSSDAYSQLVERLLASPHYGERQARLWLDVVRYADTHGYERDEFRPLAWKYRDYVIRSFNHDKSFDQFIREQLAGDELVEGTPKTEAEADSLIATGYLRLGQWDSTAAIFQEEERLRAEQMADLTNTTAAAFLGMTMSCCQCHDHKYDPLSQADHYRFRAFFAAVEPHDDFPVSVVESGTVSEEGEQNEPERAMMAFDSGATAPATHILYQGDFSSPREEVVPGFASVLSPGPATITPPRENTTGRRLALANWIASPENPWTARVIVNRIWQQHFGSGIIATPNDFGYSGARPTHPELFDWLAVEFMQQGWSIKSLHRWIVNSATYRQSSQEHALETQDSLSLATVHSDPENKLLWRQNIRRLDAETLRDALLSVSGLLLPWDRGRPLWPEVPDELTHAQPAILEALKNDDGGRMQGWYIDPVEQTDVRSIFLIRKRCLPVPFLQAFDLPDSTVSCARRDTTVVAPQALMLLNSPEGIRFAEALAQRLDREVNAAGLIDIDHRMEHIALLFRLALNREPDAEERELALEFLQRHAEQHHSSSEAPNDKALINLCRAILNLNEFIYID
jgi:hypothetical protein